MLLQILADALEMDLGRDAVGLEFVGITDAREHQELG